MVLMVPHADVPWFRSNFTNNVYYQKQIVHKTRDNNNKLIF